MKRRIKTIIALALVGCMTIGSSIVVFADPAVIDGDTPNVSAGAGDDIKVEGDVTSGGVEAGTDSKVEVTGSVTANDSEYAMGIMAANGASVTVGGDVTSNSNAIETAGPVTVTVGGNVNSNAEVVCAMEGSKVIIGGDATAGTVAIRTGTNAFSASGGKTTEITVSGAVSGETGVVDGEASGTENDLKVVVEGTLKGTEDAVLFETVDGQAPKAIIIAHKTEGNISQHSWNDSLGGYNEKKDASEFVNYILVKDSDNIGFSSGTTEYEVNGKKYDTAKAGADVVITVKEGYGVKSGTVEVTKNADGTYSIVVPKGGGVTLTTEVLQAAVDEIGKEEAKEEGKKDKKDDKDDDKKDESKTIATIASNNVSPFVAYAPVLTIGGGQAVLSGGTFGADTGIKMEEPGPLAEAAFAQAMPEGFTKGFSFSVTNGGQTTYSIKNGKISFKIPAQYLLAGRQFKLIGVDKDGNTKVFDNVATEDGSFEADVDIEGYQFELVYKD